MRKGYWGFQLSVFLMNELMTPILGLHSEPTDKVLIYMIAYDAISKGPW